jgi:hypothetical protein
VSPFDHAIWVGATDKQEEGRFKWILGNGRNISNYWYPGQPDNIGGAQNCLLLLRGATFDDGGCFAKKPFVCEK